MWLDIDSSLQTSDSKWLDSSRDSTLTRINFRWLWLEGLVTLSWQKWLGTSLLFSSVAPKKYLRTPAVVQNLFAYTQLAVVQFLMLPLLMKHGGMNTYYIISLSPSRFQHEDLTAQNSKNKMPTVIRMLQALWTEIKLWIMSWRSKTYHSRATFAEIYCCNLDMCKSGSLQSYGSSARPANFSKSFITYTGWLKKMRTHILFDKKPIF